jgi:hypothetical protein
MADHPTPDSKHLRMLTATATDMSIQVTDQYRLEQWKMQCVPLAKEHLRQWGPQTHA